METASLKALAIKVLEGNREGNQQETKSFPRVKNRGAFSGVRKPEKGVVGTCRCGCKDCLETFSWQMVELPETEPWTHEHRRVSAWKCESCGEVYSMISETNESGLIQ